MYEQGFWIYLYFRIRHSFAHLRPVILSADWSNSRLQSWTCLSLPTVAEFVKLTQSIVVEARRQSSDLYKVQLCNRQFFVVSTAIYVVKVYECHPLGTSLFEGLDVMLISFHGGYEGVCNASFICFFLLLSFCWQIIIDVVLFS